MIHAEDNEQEALFTWAQLQTAKVPELATLFAIPNGGKRNAREAARMKLQGVKAGVSDVCLPVKRNGFGSLWIEMKAPGKKKNLSKSQKSWLALMNTSGNRAVVCDTWGEAAAIILEYLRGR
jgi:hypothetical protein